MAAKRYLAAKDKAALYERFVAAKLTAPLELIQWFEDVADEMKIEPSCVRGWIAEMDELHRKTYESAIQTDAQRRMSIIGPLQVEALLELREQIKAGSSRVIHDRDGNVIQTLEFPDNQARLGAIEKVLRVTKSYPKEELDVTHHNVNPLDMMSEEEIDAELRKTRAGLEKAGDTTPARKESPKGSK